MKIWLLILSMSFNSVHVIAQNSDEVLKKLQDYSNIEGMRFKEFTSWDIGGNKLSAVNLENKITFVSFWFGTCSPCHAEFEKINELFIRFAGQKKFQILTFSFDTKTDILETIKKYQLSYDVATLSNEDCHRLMFNKGFPTNFVVNQNGIIVSAGTGVDKNGEDQFATKFVPAINKLLLAEKLK